MAQITIQQAFELGLQHHRGGRLLEAEQLYRQILSQQPNHPDALHYLGVIAHQVGQNDIALNLIRRAIGLQPNYAEAYSNLGNILKNKGLLEDAITAYRQAIALRPELPEAHNNLGNVLRDNGQLEEAIAACRQAILLQPNYSDAYCNLGSALRDMGQLDDGIAAFERATALAANSPVAHANLANALRDGGRLDEAVVACRRAIILKPDFPEAYCYLGDIFREMGRTDEAITAYRQAIAIAPDIFQAHNNLGSALEKKGRFDEAIAAYRRAISLRPDIAQAHVNLGSALMETAELDEAIAIYRHTLKLKPDYSEVHSNLAYALLFHPASNASAIALELQSWNQKHARPLEKFQQPHFNSRSPDRCLRVGYVGADFREHCQALFLLPLLSSHDRAQVEVFCYSNVRVPDARTEELRKHTQGWREIFGRSDEELARTIRQDRIDILVDLTMHMASNRLLIFARKPAPVQVTWLAYPGSTGLTTIDYRLSDPYLDPPSMDESIYSERTIRLPDSFWCYDPLDCHDIAVNALPALEGGNVTFGCLNSFCKINDQVLSLWARVLRQVNGSRLLLLSHEGCHRQRTVDQLFHYGIQPERIEFASPRPRLQYMALYHRIDVALDSFPYNGHTTSLDSFWMGVPVVTLVGQTAVSRAGWCQLSNLKLTELAAQTPEQFVSIAVKLAQDLPRLNELRSTLRQRMERSPLMDAPKFARNIETAYRQMWRSWCGEAPGER